MASQSPTAQGLSDQGLSDQAISDQRSQATADVIARAQAELEDAASDAVQALVSVARGGEDAPRVKAATEILDRIGVSRRQIESSVAFPEEMMRGILVGMATMFGMQTVGEPQIRNVTAAPVAAKKQAAKTKSKGKADLKALTHQLVKREEDE